MLRLPVSTKRLHKSSWSRMKSSSSYIRSTFIEYFTENHGHKLVKSSSVVPMFDSTVPFVNAGMNQFKGVFLGKVAPPCLRAVNSQKCVRVGGKHNDLDVVGTDGHHHTFFEMLGNWSFGDYYKKEACQMAWDLLLGPYRLKPDQLVVTYFAGDPIIGLIEDRECRDIWRKLGVPDSRLRALDSADNFWEMGATGPCGPCTEIHYVNPDGSLTEIWNLVFIQCRREPDGKVKGLRQKHVDTGLGLERLARVLQRVPTNYDTDLFQPIIKTIEQNTKAGPYTGKFGAEAALDCAYRRLADHARMLSVCLADDVYPSTSLNLKQIMRKSFKIATDVFGNNKLVPLLYDQVVTTLGHAYPELGANEKAAKLIIEHENQSYVKMRAGLQKKWKDLVDRYPEVETLSDVELGGFALGYKEFKETMSKQKTDLIPGELVFKLYDTHGFQQDIIERIAALNNLKVDKEGFEKLLTKHKSRHKTAFKEQATNIELFDQAIEKLVSNSIPQTNDEPKYDYKIIDNKIVFEPLKTKVVAIINDDGQFLDYLEPCVEKPYCVVTRDTNFYCEEGGQIADSGLIKFSDAASLIVDSVFKIRNYVFHKGHFVINGAKPYVNSESDVELVVNNEKRLNVMRNHTAAHLINAAIRRVLPDSVMCQIGSNVSDAGVSLSLSVYGEKLSPEVVLKAQDYIRSSIECNNALETRIVDSVSLSQEQNVLSVRGETYPETGLRLVTAGGSLVSKELCCGTHVPSTGFLEEFCITNVKGANTNNPTLYAITGQRAKEAREIFCRVQKFSEVVDLAEPERRREEAGKIRRRLADLCGTSGAPYGDYAACLALMETLLKKPVVGNQDENALGELAQAEILTAISEALDKQRRFTVHFIRCSYLVRGAGVSRAMRAAAARAALPVLMVGCAGGVLHAAASVPEHMITADYNASLWLRCASAVFDAELLPAGNDNYAEMNPTSVSLITCEQLVSDAMRVAIKFAQAHTRVVTPEPSQDRQHN